MMVNKLRDEILELLWSLREKGSKSITDVVKGIADNDTSDMIRKMEKSGYVNVTGSDIEFTDKGEARGRDLTRRHRLAERLFHDVLEVGMEESVQLKELEVGLKGRIVFIRPSESTRLERLATMGIVPGGIIRLKQKRPSFVLEIDETSLAVDSLIAEEIYVKEYFR
ncbi:MAG: FeoA domain-containing protein [Nitrospirae bacterium]|nr:FeoA domain-containing protein [Nitrospirota bacterium]